MTTRDQIITWASYLYRPSKRKLIGYSRRLQNQVGLEIGGPSRIFSLKGHFPVYLVAKRVDGVNYSNETIWEGAIREGMNYRFHQKTGFQYIREATQLTGIGDATYDFVLSSHSLEHVANPLLALREWNRVLKPGGTLVLVLPDKHHSFDIRRPYTTMQHILHDYQANTPETDQTHFREIIDTYTPVGDSPDYKQDELAAILKDNLTRRIAHHHVFDFALVREMLAFHSFEVVYQQAAAPVHLVTIAQKPVS